MIFRFEREQKVCRIGGINIGGQPGENPTVLIGGIFYGGHRIVEDRKAGKFDRSRAEELINRQDELSDQTGIPCMIDVVGIMPGEFEPYLDFVSGITDVPILIDAWKIPIKVEGARYAVEVGLGDRVIYNSLAPWSEDMGREVAEIRGIGLKSGLLMAYNESDPTPEGRIVVLKEVLLPSAAEAEFENVLVDTSVINLPSAAFSLLASYRVKDEFGLPVGCGPGNATSSWKFPREAWGDSGFAGVDSSCHAIASMLWNDFLFYGPIEHAQWIFPAVAASSSILSTLVYEQSRELPKDPSNPLNRFFPEFVEKLKSR